jgi:H/ACA ribonucleoprotein complex subunit 1
MQEGVLATAYASGDKFFIDPYKLLPMDRFLPQPKGATAPRGGGRGGETSTYWCTLLSSCFRGFC